MYNVKVKNHDEVLSAIKRIDRRKGKTLSAKMLQDGDLFRQKQDHSQLLVFKTHDLHYGIYPAWSSLFGHMCVGSGGDLKEIYDVPVVLLAHKADYPQPDMESPIKTIVHPRADGTYCCQNMVYFHSGQHFHITADKLQELRNKNDRDWIQSPNACVCDLPLGKVKEYDGAIHE